MNLTMLIARSADRLCARFTALFPSTSQGLGFTRQINSYAHLWISRVQHAINAGVIHMLDMAGTLSCESPSRAQRGLLKQKARGVAVVIVIALSLGIAPADGISNTPYNSIKELADYQLTEKQEYCHNAIIYRESRYKIDAVNGSHYGYYQIRNKLIIDSPYDYQFYFYWKYVSHRYGITQYDEPNYCKALHHLRVKGWQ